MTKFQIEKCDLHVWFKFILVLLFYFHADMFCAAYMMVYDKTKKNKKPLNWTAKHPNQVTFHL